jgi:hypothetical protein
MNFLATNFLAALDFDAASREQRPGVSGANLLHLRLGSCHCTLVAGIDRGSGKLSCL